MFSNKAVERQEKMLKSVNHQPYFSHIRLFALHMIKSDGNYIISQGDLQLEELKAGSIYLCKIYRTLTSDGHVRKRELALDHLDGQVT